MGSVFVFIAWRFGVFSPSPEFLPALLWFLFFAGATVLSLIDIKWGIIPDELHIFFFIIGAVLFFIPGANLSHFPFSSPILSHVSAALISGLFFAFLVLITKGKGMGWGDVKLAAVLGFLFGFPAILLVFAAAFIIGALWGVAAIIFGKKSMKDSLPFGPFLVFASFLTLLFGSPLWEWYWSVL